MVRGLPRVRGHTTLLRLLLLLLLHLGNRAGHRRRPNSERLLLEQPQRVLKLRVLIEEIEVVGATQQQQRTPIVSPSSSSSSSFGHR